MLGELEQLVILGVLHAGRDAYGVPVHDEIQRRANRELTLGTIYKTLSRLEDKGLIASEWGLSENKQRAKFYRLTAAGKKQLSAEQSKWKLLVKAIAGVMKPAS